MTTPVPSRDFYGTFHGHKLEYLSTLAARFRVEGRSVVWLVGDSTLDNKYWVRGKREGACNGYEQILVPPAAVPDVTHHINAELVRTRKPWVAINAAVEESTVSERVARGWLRAGTLLPQDRLVRDQIRPGDVLVVSVGGNDVILKPAVSTVVALSSVMASSDESIVNGTAWGWSYLIEIFRDSVDRYVSALVAKHKPALVVYCGLYYPSRAESNSWASMALSRLNPDKLQLVIRCLYTQATERIRIPGVTSCTLPLYEVLDGTQPEDYVERVEPSSLGGLKMAKEIVKII